MFWTGSIIINILWVFLLLFSLDGNQLSIYFSSENLTLPAIYKDIFIDKFNLSGWKIEGAPNFFPDMAVFFLLNLVFSSFKTAMLFYSVIQYTAIIVLLNALARQISANISWNYMAFGNMLMLLMIFVTTMNNDFDFTVSVLSIGFYIGPFIMSLLSLYLLLRYLKTAKQKFLYILFFVGLLSYLSNDVYVVMFLLPSFVLLFFARRESYRLKILRAALVLVSILISGFILSALFRQAGIIGFNGSGNGIIVFADVLYSFRILAAQYIVYIYYFDLRGLIAVLSAVSFGLMIFIGWKYYKRIFWKKEKGYNVVKAFYVFFIPVWVLMVFFRPVALGQYDEWALLVKNIHIFMFLLFNSAFLLYFFVNSKKTFWKRIFKRSFLIFYVLIIGYTFIFIIRGNIREGAGRYFSYSPEYVECVDSYAQKLDLQYGVADYSMAQKITMFSKQGLRVYPVDVSLSVINDKSINLDWYFNNNSDFSTPEFIFVVVNKLGRDDVEKALGITEDLHHCKGPYKVMVYPEFYFEKDNDEIKIAKLKN